MSNWMVFNVIVYFDIKERQNIFDILEYIYIYNGFIFDSNDDDALLFKKEEIDCCCRENKSESYKKKKIDVIYKIFRSIYLNTSLLILIQKNLFN